MSPRWGFVPRAIFLLPKCCPEGNSDAQHELVIGHLEAFDFHSVVVFTILIAVRPGWPTFW